MSVTPSYAPMEMRAVAEIPTGAQWQYEPKWDGFRCLAHRDGDAVELTSKSGQALGRYFPEIVRALRDLPLDPCSFDGELLVAIGDAPSFDALSQRIHPAASRVAMLAEKTPATYLVFDLLRDDRRDVVAEPLAVRRAALERIAERYPTDARLRLSPATTSRAIVDAWFAEVGGAMDGVIAKRLDLPYMTGSREGAVKIKRVRTVDCVVGGYRFAAGTTDRVGSLLLGLYDAAGLLDAVGVCSAFATPERLALVRRLAPYVGSAGDGAGFSGSAPGTTPSRWSRDPDRDRSFVALRPELVLEVAFDQVTAGRIRHGTKPLRWRTEKPPHACTSDQLEFAGSLATLLPAHAGSGELGRDRLVD